MAFAIVPTQFRLDELLVEAGISQRELAARADVSPTTVNRMAANLTTRVDLATLDSLSTALTQAIGRQVTPGDLLDYRPQSDARKRTRKRAE